MMKVVYRIFILLTIASVWFTLSSYESGAAMGRRSATGAPFGNGTCGNCHSGGNFGTVNVSIQVFEVGTTTPITSYVGGKTYDAKLSINATTPSPFYAFQMVSVNATNAQAGTWSGFPTNVRGVLLSARTYIEQSTKLTANTYKMTWVAPVAGTGAVKFYACGNAVDASGDESGDNTGTTTLSLTEQTIPTCTSPTLATSSTNAACVGSATGSATVTPTGGTTPYTYLWSNGASSQTATNLLPGTYTVTVTEGGGCKTTSNAITVGANTLTAAITASGATTFCPGGSVNLTASGGTSYTWSTGATTATLSNITAAGTYTVTVTSGACTATASKTVTVSTAPTAAITASGATTFCQGGSVNLTASGGTSYTWSTGATTPTLSNISTSGVYTVTVTNGTCSSTASQTVTVTPTPTAAITASGPTTFCPGGSVNLTATGGTNYKWSTGATTATLSNITTAGTYTVTVTSGSCTSTASQTVVVSNSATANITASGATTFCQGGSVNLTATGGGTYKWSTGATTATISNISASGTYAVTVTNGACTATASQIVTVSTPPTATITASGATTFCQGGSVNLTASGGTAYTWSNGVTTATVSNIATSGTYTVTVVNGSCSAISSKTVTVTPAPTATITASGATTFCQGGSINLTASGGTAYTWSNGSTTATISNVATSGTYSVTATNGTCTATASKLVTVTPIPVAAITASGATTFCQGGNVNLTASGGTTYSWSNGSTTATLSNVIASGTYTVTVANGTCTATASKQVKVNPLPVAAITASGATSFCQGSNVNLTASGGTSYAWSTGVIGTTLFFVNKTGTYTVSVTDANNCVSTASQAVTADPIPVPVIAASGRTTFCQGNNVILTASGGTNYTWSNGTTGATTTASTSGIYTVAVANGGCKVETSKAITVIPAPSVTFTSTPSDGLNGTATANVRGGTPPYTYDWNNNATNYTLIGLSSGTYFLTVTDANGCTTEGSVEVKALVTGTKDLNKTVECTISPMPNNGRFLLKVELPTEQTVHLEIFNTIGQQVAKQAIWGKNIAEPIDVSPLSIGQYLVKINTESGVITRWMIIVK